MRVRQSIARLFGAFVALGIAGTSGGAISPAAAQTYPDHPVKLVLAFGAGGTMVEILGDHSVTLPPLNTFLVKDLIKGTHVAKLLGTFRQMPAVNMDALESVLLRVSEMVCELPMLMEMD